MVGVGGTTRDSSGLIRTRCGRTTWYLVPETADLLLAAGLDMTERLRSGAALLVKDGPHRTVHRIELPGVTIYHKQCKLANCRAWGRELLRPPKARLEFDNARRLTERGIRTIEPLAWGTQTDLLPGPSFLISREQPNTQPLDEFLLGNPAVAVRQQIATCLGGFLARLHDAGVCHPDLHPGNLLIEQRESGEPIFYLLDVHAIGFGSPMNDRQSIENLAMFNRWFVLRATRTDRLRCLRAYYRERTSPPIQPYASAARRIERRTLESNLRLWRSRDGRCWGSNRQFQRVHAAGVCGHAVRDLDPTVVQMLTDDPDLPFHQEGSTVLKDGRSTTVVRWTVHGRSYIWKRFRVVGVGDALKNVLRLSPALRSWYWGHVVVNRGLPTPRPLLVLHRRRYGLSGTGYLLTEAVDDPRDLHTALRTTTDRSALLHAVARVVRDLHERCLVHRDLKPGNILIGADGRVRLIDLVGMTSHRGDDRRGVLRDLMRLNAGFYAGGVSRTERLRFLLSYLGAGLRPTTARDEWWRAIAKATAAKVARNKARNRPLA